VHDIAFDLSGKRIATCSSDQRIRIWEKKTIDGNVEWVLTDELTGSKGHSGAVLKA
jgi:nucleoporin SEH1